MEGSDRKVVVMAFGLPLMTTVIVIGSMYAGHIMTTRSDRPTNVMVSAASPNIDVAVKVPELAPPQINVTASPANVDVHVPQQLPPTVTVNTPTAAAPNITVNPAAPTVTVINQREEKEHRVAVPEKIEKPVDAKPVPAVEAKPEVTAAKTAVDMPKPPVPSALKPATETIKPQSENLPEKKPAETQTSAAPTPAPDARPILVSAATAVHELNNKPLSIETLYECANQYIESYCRKNRLDPVAESRKWNRLWKANVEQSINDNIDSGEQSYINRIVIVKRDCFNIEKATPEKIVEACRIMLRYRDGELAWLEAMKEALTQDNLKKTVAFLTAGPQ
jgi:hypothetical protein